MNRCRVSEEDARDPYFDGEDPMREDFETYAEDIRELSQGLLQDVSWTPDHDDIEAAQHLIQHLRYYYLKHNRKVSK